MRNIIVAGNWKMNKDRDATQAFCSAIKEHYKSIEAGVEVIIAPAFPMLDLAKSALTPSSIKVSAQDVSFHDYGAYTSEVCAAMLSSLNISHCIVGHSERRQYHHETDARINLKLKKLLEAGLCPILCIGETLEEREAELTEKVVLNQLEACLMDISADEATGIVIAYEPVWAIGTGKTASSMQAQEVHAFIRNYLVNIFSSDTAANIHILYGGSMNENNMQELISMPDIDGGLIGGASLVEAKFFAMIDIAIQTAKTRR